MRILIVGLLALHVCVAHAKNEGRVRWEKIAADVEQVMKSPNAKKNVINTVGVDVPSADWCAADSMRVTTCGSARPKRDLYWLAVFCKDQLRYVAEYEPKNKNSLTLIDPQKKQVCRKVK
jgi:hypothetical protein